MDTYLHIAERLRKLLKPLTKEEKAQLKENIHADGRVIDPILYWFDGKKNVVVDGMHRWEIIRGTDLKFRTEQMKFADYDEAEIWILDHQLGRRNLLKPSAIRKIRGELYNRLKTQRGGDHTSEKAKYQNNTLLGDAAQKVAEKAGVSESTVKRDGARVEAIEGLSKAAQAVAESASDAEVKALAKLDKTGQDAVARAVRTGQAATVKEAIKATGSKPKKDLGRCPNCHGTKWDEDEDGVSCSKCSHPWGEPAGDVDDKEIRLQRSKTVKTCEALQRAFDDLNSISPNGLHKEAAKLADRCLEIAKAWLR